MIKIIKGRDGLYKIFFGAKMLGATVTKRAAQIEADAYKQSIMRIKKRQKLKKGDLTKIFK